MINYFKILGVSENANKKEIRDAYIALVKKYHPDNSEIDKHYAEEQMKLINEAYRILEDDDLRTKHLSDISGTSEKADSNYSKESQCNSNDVNVSDYTKVPKKKKSIFRRFWFWVIVLFIILKIKDSDSINEIGSWEIFSKENEETNVNMSLEEINELPIYSLDYLTAYIEYHDIQLPKVHKKNMIENILSDNSDMVAVKTYGSSKIEYSLTSENSDLYYVGDIKDNKPNGKGKIYKIVSGYEYQSDSEIKMSFGPYFEYEELYPVLIYAGEFKDGYYDGYGWEFTCPYIESDEYSSLGYQREIGDDYVQLTDDISYNVLATCNPLAYMGEFKKGQYSGNGIQILYPIHEISAYYDTEKIVEVYGSRIDREIVIYSGEYKKGERKGKTKEYCYGKLFYDGEIKRGYRNGEGTMYYMETEQVKYDGEWKNDEYHGKGTLYDLDGSVIYDGEWSYGDYDS